ncbi:pyruvate dehydrogenase E2 component (dihydrolipoamide acetyltransferase) [Spinactinospora alkalitolerans]|uniref:Dihydrolipoamide acetyltransferase component of pyruvate dehydrogenase complex n=1 Tax=Spinactinospora alkalitolerans TaxID=687207 RepID=A0A852U0Q1_9ACTN|nr:dihydrolipoamide acetyltransferase family protein [Spinactinospora alkalitolerans]NYE48912.1 pyruvate dehydrogenase E2 component (dihydrolipoamide acetyltransferase) [Spinactinospora alkalitolerans]
MSAPRDARTAVRHFALPDLGEGLTEAEILHWLVEVGDTVAVDQPVAEVETAKAAVEVPCPYGGVVTALHGAPGETVAVGAPLIGIDTTAPEGGGFTEPGVVVPEARAADPAEHNGGGNGATAGESGSGAVLVGYGTGEGTPRRRRGGRALAADGPRTTASRAPFPAAPVRPASGRTPVVSPLVRRMAREHGVDVDALSGTGGGGLVLRRDVVAALSRQREAARARPEPAAAGRGEAERVPMRGARRAMAERLSRSRREIPEATVWVDADATGLLALRSSLNEADPDRPVSLLALLAKFCVLGLRRFPSLNSQVDAERGELVRFAHVDLGFAAQTPRGLVVPVVRDAHRMSTRELSAALGEATASARAGGLTPAQLTGGTFTVNNYGVFGVDGSAAIINHPEAAILGMGRVVKRPWVVGDELAVRPVTELTLAFDHRVCDGEEAGGFLRFVADCVERPELLLGDL